MNVKNAIKKIQQRLERAHRNAEEYLNKADDMKYFIAECDDDSKGETKKLIFNYKRRYYYHRSVEAEDYAEELEEVINVLENKDPDCEVKIISEEKLEEEYGIYGEYDIENEEWSNVIATVTEYRNSSSNKSILVICMLKKL